MHFSRSLAGVALLGVFAAMAFAGAATGAPAQSEKSQATRCRSTGQSLGIERLGTSRLTAGRRQSRWRRTRTRPCCRPTRRAAAREQPDRNVAKVQKASALSYKAPAGINATAVATQDQPITGKNPAVLSKTGVNAWQQETFGGYNLEPPDPSLCAGQGFVVQVVNSQVQISDGNLNHLTAPISMESFFGDFANTLFDPLCSYNHSTGRFYMTEAVSDFATFSGVYIAVSTSSDPRGVWNIYFLDLGTFGGDGASAPQASASPTSRTSGRTSTRSRSRRTSSTSSVADCASGFCGAAYVLIDKRRPGARATVPERRRVRHLDARRPSRRTSSSETASPVSERAGTRSSRRTQPTDATTPGTADNSGP